MIGRLSLAPPNICRVRAADEIRVPVGRLASSGPNSPTTVSPPDQYSVPAAFLATPPNFGFHALTGDRKGTYAMTLTKNWRMTFTKVDDQTIGDLDLEDYHGD